MHYVHNVIIQSNQSIIIGVFFLFAPKPMSFHWFWGNKWSLKKGGREKKKEKEKREGKKEEGREKGDGKNGKREGEKGQKGMEKREEKSVS